VSSIDRAAIDLVLARMESGPVAKRLLIERTKKGHKKALRSKIPGLDEYAIQAVKQDPQLRWKICAARMTLGSYKNWDGWEFRDPTMAYLHGPNGPFGPVWDGKRTDKLYVLGEQGVGDEVLFSQCILDAIEALGHRNIVLDTDPRLIPIFERSFGIECVPRLKFTDPRPGMTGWSTLGHLCRLFRTGERWNGRPYLLPSEKRVVDFSWARGKQAVSWRGAQGSYPVREFVAAVGTGVDVQYGEDSDLLESPGIDKREDLEGLLGIFSNVNRLVSPSTTAVHLAAAVGCKVELILAPPKSGKRYDQLPWRWGMEDRTPWYNSVRIHRSLKQFVGIQKRECRTSTVAPPPQS
jgi:hypothetical protein